MKNCHPVILLWICDKFSIDAPKLREYVENRPHHLAELGKVTNGKDLPVHARPLLSHPHVTSLLRLVQSQPEECTAPLYSPPLLVCFMIVVELARSTFCLSEPKSCSSWRCRFSARNEIRFAGSA